ncbi:hypothetical protein KSS90_11680 [Pseudomonas maumuensis]|uniref:Uncharacterized protein n=1 Tax=Pseudomonas maumuensis TaxID=2842354 RepID=A0ABX8NRZ3_9PSED|nr:hypothetical protein KSS90_11680 [Pseudomonas maumuensis]
MGRRGWTKESLEAVIENPSKTVTEKGWIYFSCSNFDLFRRACLAVT